MIMIYNQEIRDLTQKCGYIYISYKMGFTGINQGIYTTDRDIIIIIIIMMIIIVIIYIYT